MNRLFSLFFCLSLNSIAIGQVIFEPSPAKPIPPRWAYDAFSYADFGTGEEHSYFSVVYKLNPKLHAELQGFYDSYRGFDLTAFSLRAKWYPTKKLYFFSGAGVRIQRSKIGNDSPTVPFQILNGVGYEPNGNITIEAVHDLNFNENSDGLNATPSLFTLKGKYRFK